MMKMVIIMSPMDLKTISIKLNMLLPKKRKAKVKKILEEEFMML